MLSLYPFLYAISKYGCLLPNVFNVRTGNGFSVREGGGGNNTQIPLVSKLLM